VLDKLQILLREWPEAGDAVERFLDALLAEMDRPAVDKGTGSRAARRARPAPDAAAGGSRMPATARRAIRAGGTGRPRQTLALFRLRPDRDTRVR